MESGNGITESRRLARSAADLPAFSTGQSVLPGGDSLQASRNALGLTETMLLECNHPSPPGTAGPLVEGKAALGDGHHRLGGHNG